VTAAATDASLVRGLAPTGARARAVIVRAGLRLVVPALILLAWWALSQTEKGMLFVAPPLEAFQQAYDDFVWDKFGSDLVPSVSRAMQGFALAVVAGVTAGIALGRNRYLMALFQPLIHLGRSLPTPALLGVFFFLFGTGDAPKILLIAFTVVWPILFNTIDGATSVGNVRLQAASVFKISRWDRLFRIILPGAAPKIFAGMRTALSLSLIIMIISELQKSTNGLGYLLVQAQRDYDYAAFWSVLIVLAILGVVLNLLFTVIERRVLAWHRGATQHHD
jgi:ABC-type nitrate/sulfonate/bicarbonate transport system permease component